MKDLLTGIICLLPLLLSAQECNVFHEADKETGEITIFAHNSSIMPYSVKVECTYKGMTTNENFPLVSVVPAGTRTKLAVFTPKKGVSYSFNYSTLIIKGNIHARHNDQVIYELPFPKGKSYRVDQGYNGKVTHQGKNALDFHMDEGTEICAIREGKVVEIVESNKRGCPDESCDKYNNYILVLHDDDTFADYAHLQKGGALVNVGDMVEAGQVIGLSGSTGVASGPHLHLEVYIMEWGGQKSVPAKYNLEGGPGIPQEEKTYKRF